MLRRFYQLVKSSNDFLESPRGLWFIALLIKINAIVLGLQTISHLPHSLHTVLEVADQIILGVFVCELVIRLLAERLKFFLSGWNVVDLVIVLGAMSFTHTFLPILRVFRALHLLSMVDTSPKLKHMLAGLRHSIPGFFSVLSIFVILFYVYAVIGVYLFKHTDVEGFHHIGSSMKTMFQVLSGDDWSVIMRKAELSVPHAWFFFISFYIILVFIILNLFVGVVVGALQEAEEKAFGKKKAKEQDNHQIKAIQESLKEMKSLLEKMNANGEG